MPQVAWDRRSVRPWDARRGFLVRITPRLAGCGYAVLGYLNARILACEI